MHRLVAETRRYAWGSRTLLPRFLDAPIDGDPHAELWIGAHPGAPSRTSDGTSLIDLIEDAPEQALGRDVATRFGARLPFLMKALAAAEPLSLQVHPTAARARAGYMREDETGIAVDSPLRSYRDRSHKPELIYAVTRFEGMAGFRDVERSAEILRMLALPWAADIADDLLVGRPEHALERVVSVVLGLGPDRLTEMLAGLTEAARAAEELSHHRRPPSTRRHRDRAEVTREAARLFAQTAALADRYPNDPGVLVTLLLNHVVLAPGEAMFLDAGMVHAYTSGFGVEIMASSDNVVRAGLTPKHVDVPELLEIASFTPVAPPLCPAEHVDDAVVKFRPDVKEFTLYIGDGPTERLPSSGPRILLVLDGEVVAITDHEKIQLRRGEAVFVADADGQLHVTGTGRVAVGAVGAFHA